ncbi:hypothetical protein MU1_09320 [Paenibacillus glycanilyticus]|uniref:Uncharacterized protein n=2 Tax=Paenibacillus glycanilyticus TaxID=126569 RepID=A0ABQ6GBE3_9BACL|nr:hypothetical protein MU1_09320 [Paenibacillus glycanilyticus]
MKQEWIDVVNQLADNPALSITCPDCGCYVLEILDVDSPLNTVDFERYIACSHCKAQAVIKMKRKKS